MKWLARILSAIALLLTLAPSGLYLAGVIDHDAVKWTALLGAVLWFVATPLWMGGKLPVDAAEVEI